MKPLLAPCGRPPFDRRRAGVLLALDSLPSAAGSGPLGAPAMDWLDWLAAAGFSLWQVLPIHPLHGERSPYQPRSLFAGGEHLLCPALLEAQLGRPIDGDEALRSAVSAWLEGCDAQDRADYRRFCRAEADWLDAWAAWAALRRQLGDADWRQWPARWRARPSERVAQVQAALPAAVEAERGVQFLFERQWRRLRAAAAGFGVLLFGDLPIYPALDSAEVWAEPELFRIDGDGQPLEAGGAPPDAFNADGQVWGGAIPDWAAMAAQRYAWWQRRARRQAALFDVLRIDHFRGFVAYWSVPPGASSAASGQWRPGPGRALFEALAESPLPPLVAEDLGDIDAPVEALRSALGLPGCRVLQFAFDGDPANPHLPDHHPAQALASSGTHDNDTLLGWWQALPAAQRSAIGHWLRGQSLPEALLDRLLESRALLAVLPAQDLIGLGSEARLNRPGTVHGNWRWRVPAEPFDAALARFWQARLAAARRLP